MKRFSSLSMAIILCFYMAGPILAQDNQDAQIPQEPLGSAQEPQDAVTAGAGGADTAAPGNVTMDFKEADISNVLRILSYKGGVNIVAGPEVTGMVTIRLTDVPWEKALDVILRTYGFAYEREGNIIRVTTIESLKLEELTTEVYSLNYAKAKEVSEAMKEMLTDRGKIKFDDRTNVVIVTDIPTNLYKISQIVDKLDKRTPQVLIEAKIIEVTLADDERLGIDWDTVVTVTGAERPTKLPFIDTWYSDSQKIYPQPEYSIDADGVLTSAFPSGPERLFNTLSDVINFKQGAFPAAAGADFQYGTLDFTQFQAVLEFIKERTDTDVLSNPRIVTLNNKEATILVGEKMLFPSFALNEDTGDLVITGFQDQKDLGVKLKVTPHINAQGDIVMELNPQIDDFIDIQVLDLARGIVAPIFTTREAKTEVMARDGDTIMMAGLITSTTTDEEQKVPILGDIPLIGDYFFKWKDKSVDRTELIIFITVHLMEEKWPTHMDPNTSLYKMPAPHDQTTAGAVPDVGQKKKNKWYKKM